MVELASRRPGGFSTPRLHAVASYSAQPGANARPGSAGQARSRGDRSRIPPTLRRGPSRARRSTNSPEYLVEQPCAATVRPAHRLLFRRVRSASIAADIRRRPGCARRRSLQRGQRPWRTAHRRGFHVPPRLLPSAHLCRRLAGGKLRASELGGRAGRTRHHA